MSSPIQEQCSLIPTLLKRKGLRFDFFSTSLKRSWWSDGVQEAMMTRSRPCFSILSRIMSWPGSEQTKG